MQNGRIRLFAENENGYIRRIFGNGYPASFIYAECEKTQNMGFNRKKVDESVKFGYTLVLVAKSEANDRALFTR